MGMKAGLKRGKSRAWLCVAALAVVAGCGVEVGGDGVVTTAGGGTGGTGITGASVSFGSVTAFGSIFVNDVEYGTNGATVVRDDVAVDESELRVGMTVEVRGVRTGAAQGIAQTVRVEEAVRGIVEAKAGNRLVVLGQTVLVDDSTHLDVGIEDTNAIAVGEAIEVHGLLQTPGTVEASFVQRAGESLTFVARGVVVEHDAPAARFKIGALTVSYAMALTEAMPADDWNGLFVEVRGTACAERPVCGTLTATQVRPDGLDLTGAEQADIEGFVTAAAEGGFTVGTQAVVVAATTEFAGGTAADIMSGTKLDVQGPVRNGVLAAAKVAFKHDVRLESTVAAVDRAGGTLRLAGFLDLVVRVDDFTRFKSGLRDITGVAVNDGVRVRGRVTADGRVVAVDIHGDQSARNDIVLQGPALAVSSTVIAILGVPIDTASVQALKDARGKATDAVAFVAALAPGTLVKARGTRDGVAVVWEELEIEN